MVGVQIFGVKKSAATRAAERFFKERGATIQFVDLNQKPMARGEINRFMQRYGLGDLLATESKAYIDGGLRYLKLSEAELLARIEKSPELLQLPLVRAGNLLSIGEDRDAWQTMLLPPAK